MPHERRRIATGTSTRRACAVHRLAAERGFTLIEVMVSAVVLVSGLLTMLGMLGVASYTNHTNRVRQEASNVAREVVENLRALGYTQLATPSSIAAAIAPQMTPGATPSGSTLSVTRSIYSFQVSFTTCSLDDPADGYGDHTYAPASGGSWCPDVGPSGTADSNPDDYKRVSVTVTPTPSRAATTVEQTVLIYNRPTNGPAVSCLSAGNCPGTNLTVTNAIVTSLTFNVTTTSAADSIQWLVNGNPPPPAQFPVGTFDPYSPLSGSTSSQFTWTLPVPDGTYAITAVALDANGNSGTRSSVQVTLNRHQAIAPATLNAGFDRLIGGVDVQWVPSSDQDVLYYNVYHQYGNTAAALVCSHVSGTSCTDMSAPSPASPPATCSSSSQSYTTSNVYWVVGVDTDPVTGLPRESTLQSPTRDANLCDHPPAAPTGLTGSFSNGVLDLTWSVPAAPVDPDSWDSIQEWRLYRWPVIQGSQFPGASARLQLVGALNGSGGYVTSATDGAADPGAVPQNYCVTAVDTHLNESTCSNTISG